MSKDKASEADKGPAPDETQVDKDAAGNKTGNTPGVSVHPPVVGATAAAPEAVEEKPVPTAETTAVR